MVTRSGPERRSRTPSSCPLDKTPAIPSSGSCGYAGAGLHGINRPVWSPRNELARLALVAPTGTRCTGSGHRTLAPLAEQRRTALVAHRNLERSGGGVARGVTAADQSRGCDHADPRAARGRARDAGAAPGSCGAGAGRCGGRGRFATVVVGAANRAGPRSSREPPGTSSCSTTPPVG